MTPETARDFAIRVHGAQQYAGQPYVHHLDQVAAVLRAAGYDSQVWQDAAYLHDVIEDCFQDHTVEWRLAHVMSRFGQVTTDLVWAVTGVGPNRKARNADIYRKLKDYPLACTLKAADRIANLEASVRDPATGEVNLSMAQMYLKEREAFQAAVEPHINRALRQRLNDNFVILQGALTRQAETLID